LKFKAGLLTPEALKKFMELRDLDKEFFLTALERSEIFCGDKSTRLLDCRHNDPFAYFLLQGSIDCQAKAFRKQRITETCRQAVGMLNGYLPESGSVHAAADNTVLLALRKWDIEQARARLQRPLTQSVTEYEIEELHRQPDDDDWMSVLLASPLMRQVNPVRLQKLFGHFEEIACKKDQVVIREGDRDQYFYVIKSGSAQVCYRVRGEPHYVSIGPGRFFGEGALVGETVHSATVQMECDGVLCRICSDEFNEIIKQSLLRFITEAEAERRMSQDRGSLVRLDVRHPVEYRTGHRQGSHNLPIHDLRNRIGQLPEGKACLLDYGDDKRSQLAAIILIENGREALLVRDAVATERVRTTAQGPGQ